MKRILITGKNSYIGTSFEKWLERYSKDYQVDAVGTKDNEWKEKDFSQYDVVFHVAGIAHIKETSKNRDLYFSINRDLAFKIAQKAKRNRVTQFVFLSSMSVYGIEQGVINKETTLNPKTAYGKSKLEAEKMIGELTTDTFKVAILRPPMVYGKNCKGNYQKLAKLAVVTPIFPKIKNRRSMIYIDNLAEAIRCIIDCEYNGLFFPQNREYINTSEMVKLIAEENGKKIILTSLFNPIIDLLNIKLVKKIFGTLVYEKQMSYSNEDYNVFDLKSSIRNTEEK